MCRAGAWYAELPAVTAAGTVERALRYYLDHHATLDGPRWYRVRVDESDTPVVTLVYERTGPRRLSLRMPTDRRAYVCPHCDAVFTLDATRPTCSTSGAHAAGGSPMAALVASMCTSTYRRTSRTAELSWRHLPRQ